MFGIDISFDLPVWANLIFEVLVVSFSTRLWLFKADQYRTLCLR